MIQTSSPRLSLSHRLRKTPFHNKVLAANVKAYTVYNHTLLPTVFESLEADYWHLREKVQLWDVTCERQVELHGPDAMKLAQLMTPRNLERCEIGQCVYAPLVDRRGGLVNDPVLLKLAEDRIWLSLADSDVRLWADGLATGRNLDVDVVEPDASPLGVQGPLAFDLVAKVFGEWIRDIRFFRFRETEIDGIPVLIARSGWSKQGGFEIYLRDGSKGKQLWDILEQAGREFDVRAGCPNNIERIEGGLLSYGNDMTRENNPLECGLEAFCNMPDNAEVLCREALETIAERGTERKLTGVFIDGPPLASIDDWRTVEAENSYMGIVTSAIWSPRLERNIGIAMLENAAFDADNLQAQMHPNSGSDLRRLELTGLPFD